MDCLPDFVEAFASMDRTRLGRMDEAARARQLDARQALQHYVEALWEDVERCGERPEVGDKYQALALVRALTRSLTAVGFEAVYDAAPGPSPDRADEAGRRPQTPFG